MTKPIMLEDLYNETINELAQIAATANVRAEAAKLGAKLLFEKIVGALNAAQNSEPKELPAAQEEHQCCGSCEGCGTVD